MAVLDTPEEQAFDDIVFIASRTCDTPIALISLLDHDRQWFKARVGLDVGQTEIAQSVCQIDVDDADMLIIPDLTCDPNTALNPLVVGERAFRFYAGAPLILRSGVVVGRLCVIDTRPRPEGLTHEQATLLRALGRQVSDQLDLRLAAQTSARLLELQSALIEIGERIRASDGAVNMTAGVAAIVGRVLKVERASFGVVDPDVEIVDVEADWTAPGVASIAGRHRFNDYGALRHELVAGEPLVIEDVTTDHRTSDTTAAMHALDINALVNMPVRERGRTVAIFIVNAARPRIWTTDELLFLRGVADRLEAGVARLRAEQQQSILNGEINHRLKNMLSMVQAIASQTLRAVSEREPVESFERRLVALSAAHDVLVQKSWKDADLRTVAEAVVETVGFVERVTLDGPSVPLGARAALSFSLIVHELMTNACKYGSLCTEDGRVELTWSIDGSGPTASLIVRWRERGGPPIAAPSKKGFGSRLIQLGLTGTGGTELRYESEGLEADLRASIEHLV
ncbi:sensor histidine kinase [Sphingomonas sp.]|uniref:sensor histidine kinase n=1 Tax=Sphingomonas sp. TaxID=28214 RepID=UPI0028A86270|nr:HWE histidine kinase domain-containing protein [Sphingomonas sp.]